MAIDKQKTAWRDDVADTPHNPTPGSRKAKDSRTVDKSHSLCKYSSLCLSPVWRAVVVEPAVDEDGGRAP